MFDPVYVGVILIGLLHGVEPGHGWPVAVLYSMRKKNPVVSAIVSSTTIGMGHLVSSIAVVVAYVLLDAWLDFEAPWIKYLAAAILVVLAIKLIREKVSEREDQHGHVHESQPEVEHAHEHSHVEEDIHNHLHRHVKGVRLTLLSLAWFALVLGFAHEEEFALLALVAGGGVNAWLLMVSYALAVLIGLIAITVGCVKIYERFQSRLERYEKYVPKISGAILIILAITIIIW